jgi:hypothetical protein
VKKRKTEGDAYVDLHPDLARWLRTCALCGATGHDPELPDQIYRHFSLGARHLKAYFSPLNRDQYGRCDMCVAALDEDNA